MVTNLVGVLYLSIKKNRLTRTRADQTSLKPHGSHILPRLERKPLRDDFDKVATSPNGPGWREGTPESLGVEAGGFVVVEVAGRTPGGLSVEAGGFVVVEVTGWAPLECPEAGAFIIVEVAVGCFRANGFGFTGRGGGLSMTGFTTWGMPPESKSTHGYEYMFKEPRGLTRGYEEWASERNYIDQGIT